MSQPELNALLIAFFGLISALAAVVAPIILAWITARQRRKEKQEDWERQDKVAERLVKAHADIAQQAADFAAQDRSEISKHQDDGLNATHHKLDEIHHLVNSSLTAALRGELVALKAQVGLMARLVQAGISMTEEEKSEHEEIKSKIPQLQSILDGRLKREAILSIK